MDGGSAWATAIKQNGNKSNRPKSKLDGVGGLVSFPM